MKICESCRFYGGKFNGYELCNAPEVSKLMKRKKSDCKDFAKAVNNG